MLTKENGVSGYYDGTFDIDTTLDAPDISGMYDVPTLVDPTTGLAAGTPGGDSVFFLTGLGDVLGEAGTSIAKSLGPILTGIFGGTAAPATTVVAKPTSTGAVDTSGSSNMLLIAALAVGGYFLLAKR